MLYETRLRKRFDNMNDFVNNARDMFPDVEPEVIEMICDQAQGNVEAATAMLMEMTGMAGGSTEAPGVDDDLPALIHDGAPGPMRDVCLPLKLMSH